MQQLYRLLFWAIISLVFITPNNLTSQSLQQEIDSLEQHLANETLKSEAEGKLLEAIASNYGTLGNLKQEIEYRKRLLETSYAQSSAEVTFQQNLVLCQNLANSGVFDSAITYCQKAEQLGERMGSGFKIKALTALGDYYRLSSSFDMAIKTLLEAQKLSETEHEDTLSSSIYNSLAPIYLSFGQADKALLMMEKRISLIKKLGKDEQLGKAYTNLASVYAHSGQLELAKEQLEVAIQLLIQQQESSNMTRALFLLGSIEMELNQLDKAEIHFKKSLALAKELQMTPMELEGYMALAKVCFLKKDYDTSIAFCEEAKKLTQPSGFNYELEYLYSILYDNYKAKRDFEAALSAHEQRTVYKDSLLNDAKVQAIADTEAKYENEKKERENEFLIKENSLLSSRNNLFLLLIGSLIISLLVFGWLYYALRKNRARLALSNQTKDKLFSIIAHDLRGPVVSFRGVTENLTYLLDQDDFDRAKSLGRSMDQAALKVNALLDNLLDWSRIQTEKIPYQPQSIQLHTLVSDVINDHQALAVAKDIEVKVESEAPTQAWIDPAGIATVIRNLINNAIKFTANGGQIQVIVSPNGKMAELMVKDNGIGMTTDKQNKLFNEQFIESRRGTKGEKGTGIGLHICQDLIRINQGNIKVRSQLGEGTTFTINLPKEEPTSI